MELKEIEQIKLPLLTDDDEVFDEFPMVESPAWRIRWEQMDNYAGLQQVRGLDGAPQRVVKTGASAYDYEPGVYGEFEKVDEKELSERRELGSWETPSSIDDVVGRYQTKLLGRRIDRIRYIIWTLLTTGTFAIAKDDGTIEHTDTFPLKTYSAAYSWSNTSAATPFADIRGMILLQRGQSVDFGAGGRLYMNQVWINNLLQNNNVGDLYGKRNAYGATLNTLEDINKINTGNNMPEVVPYDKGFLIDSGIIGQANPQTFVPFIPNSVGVLVGKRTNGARLGEYRLTRNVNNPRFEPGPYTRVIDRGEHHIPRNLEVHDGHNGGPAIYFPGAVVVFSC